MQHCSSCTASGDGERYSVLSLNELFKRLEINTWREKQTLVEHAFDENPVGSGLGGITRTDIQAARFQRVSRSQPHQEEEDPQHVLLRISRYCTVSRIAPEGLAPRRVHSWTKRRTRGGNRLCKNTDKTERRKSRRQPNPTNTIRPCPQRKHVALLRHPLDMNPPALNSPAARKFGARVAMDRFMYSDGKGTFWNRSYHNILLQLQKTPDAMTILDARYKNTQ